MTPQQAKELLPIITAFAEGKQIQLKTIYSTWIDSNEFAFGSDASNYRIKPEPQRIRIAKTRYFMEKDTYLGIVSEQYWKQKETNPDFVSWVSDIIELYPED